MKLIKMFPTWDSVMFAASVINPDICTVQENPFSVLNSDHSKVQPDSVSDNGSPVGESHLLEDSDDDLEFTFRYIHCNLVFLFHVI